MARPVIISCAVTGGADTKGMNPAVPATPEEIANEVLAANAAGAAVAHIHVRNPETGKASMDPVYYGEVVSRVRDAGCPGVINLTTGPGARMDVNTENPLEPGPGSVMKTAEERVIHVLENKPDICSLDVATMNFGDRPMVKSPEMLTEMATVLGGHVRVGLEDNLYIARGELASGNAQLVERAVEIIEAIGEDVATPEQAREIFGLSGNASASKAAE